jgi:hypothetical protein
MKAFSFGKWHAWEGVSGILLSNEATKRLLRFGDVDACINWLFLNGEQATARKLNKHIKGEI